MQMPKNVLVTGGAGYIGSHTVVLLAQQGYQPIILDNFTNSQPQVIPALEEITGQRIQYYQGDCCDEQLVEDIFKSHPIHAVIHFAASKAVGESVEWPLHYYHNNLNSLIVLLKVMQRHQVTQFVFSSSCTIYGEPSHIPVTEETPAQEATSPYGNTKKICEDILRDVVASGSALNAVSLRYFNPIGAHASALIGELPIGTPNNLVPFITQTAAGIRDSITIFGSDYETRDGTCIRDYIHVVDLSEAHVRALQYLEAQESPSFYDVFNLGTGTGSTVLEIIKTFEEVNQIQVNYTVGPRRSGDVVQIYASVDKANQVLNWSASLTIAQALGDAWAWQKHITENGKEG